LDIDERLLRQLEQQAQRQGISLGAFLEQALRPVVQSNHNPDQSTLPPDPNEGLSDNDLFFTALEELRAAG
jgi:hypothetical protein